MYALIYSSSCPMIEKAKKAKCYNQNAQHIWLKKVKKKKKTIKYPIVYFSCSF